jgi:hypothetical protein
MDNNQQVADQPTAKPVVDNATLSHTEVSSPTVDLGLNEAKVMRGPSVQSPLSGQDVSMTVGQPYGGPIVGTEVEPNVRNETNPYDHQSI